MASSIFVPPRAAAALVEQNLVSAILTHIAFEPEDGRAAARDRAKPLTVSELRDAFAKLKVPTAMRDRVMARLLREGIVKTDGVRVWVADVASLRAYVARSHLGTDA